MTVNGDMINKTMISKLLRLSRAEKAVLLQAVAWLVWIRFLLALLAFRHASWLVQRWARSARTELDANHRPTLTAHRVGQLVTAAAYRIPGTTCLPRALVTQVLLCRHGHGAELHIGVNRDSQGRIQAHAWVETEGRVVIGGPEVTGFQPILRTA